MNAMTSICYIQTKYKAVYGDGTEVRFTTIGDIQQATLTSAEYDNGKGLPLRWNSSSKDVIMIDETKFKIK